MDIVWLVAAFGGGAFGAAIGGQTAFIFTGLLYLAGLGGFLGGYDASAFMTDIVFGPVFGPHIAFAGGATAAAYAARRNYMPAGVNGRDIVTPLAGLAKLDVYVVGGLTGMVGYLLNLGIISILPNIASNPQINYNDKEVYGSTDTVALTIIIIAIVTRFAFGRTGMFSTKSHPLFAVGEGKHWVAHQETWALSAGHGLFIGLISGFGTLSLIQNFYETVPGIAGWAQLIGWGFTAVTLVLLTCGLPTPVTHHMALIGSIAALHFAAIIAGSSDPSTWTSGSMVSALLLGGAFGAFTGVLGEALARATCSNGDTHIDPPAFAIFINTTLLYGIFAVLS